MPGLWRAGMLLLGAFLLLILAIRLPGVQALDASLLYRFNRCGSPAVSVALRRFSNFGGGDLTRYGIPLALLAHWATGRARSIRFFLFGMLGTVGLETFFKTIAHRMRPDVVSDRAYNSFPSGHVLAATVFAGLLLVLWLPACRRPRQRIILGAAALAWPVLMSIARVYLGSHYPTDVLGGLLLGSAWLCLCLALIRVPAAQPKPRAGTTTPATTGLPSASVVAAPADGLTEAASEPAPEPVLLR
jgi:membrane-associated phospholipid phosphatase